MDTPPALEAPFEDESIRERIIGLTEMFPESIRNVVGTTAKSTSSMIKWLYSSTRVVTWFVCSTAAILVLPVSLEVERHQYEEQLKNQERSIILGSEPV